MQNGYLFLSIVTSDQIEPDEITPRLFYLSYAFYDYDGIEHFRASPFLKPMDFDLSKDLENRFNIDFNFAMENGQYSYTVLSELESVVHLSSVIIGFDLHHAINVISSEYQRNGMVSTIRHKPRVNLSDEKILNYCYPAHDLQSLHNYLYGTERRMKDLDLIISCFYRLNKSGVV